MLKTQFLVPEVYYKKSRDFQIIGRTYDIVFNYLKTNIDTIYNNPLNDSSDKKLLDLLAMSLGFKSKHLYNTKQLAAMCSMFMSTLKNKGSMTSIQLAINTLLQVEGIEKSCILNFDYTTNTLYIYVSQELTDLNLFNDLLTYILPAGVSCSIIKQQLLETSPTTSIYPVNDTLFKDSKTSAAVSIIPNYQNDVKSSDPNGVFEGRIDNSTIVSYQKIYSISAIITHGSVKGDEFISSTSSTTLTNSSVQLMPDVSYKYPSSISVINASYRYDATTGLINLYHPLGNVVITATCIHE